MVRDTSPSQEASTHQIWDSSKNIGDMLGDMLRTRSGTDGHYGLWGHKKDQKSLVLGKNFKVQVLFKALYDFPALFKLDIIFNDFYGLCLSCSYTVCVCILNPTNS